MPDFGFITRDENFKVARGQYVVTSQTDPKAVKKVADKASATLTEAEKAPVKKTKAKTTTKRKTAAKRKTATRKAGSKKS